MLREATHHLTTEQALAILSGHAAWLKHCLQHPHDKLSADALHFYRALPPYAILSQIIAKKRCDLVNQVKQHNTSLQRIEKNIIEDESLNSYHKTNALKNAAQELQGVDHTIRSSRKSLQTSIQAMQQFITRATPLYKHIDAMLSQNRNKALKAELYLIYALTEQITYLDKIPASANISALLAESEQILAQSTSTPRQQVCH